MSRRLSIDEEVAGGLLRLLGYASHSMSLALEPAERAANADNADSLSDDPDPGEPGAAPSPSAAEQLFGMLKLASRGESPPERPSSRPELITREPESEPVSVRPERARSVAARGEVPQLASSSPPFPDVPAERVWRRAMTLPLGEVTDEARQVTLWLEAHIALHSTVTDPSDHDES